MSHTFLFPPFHHMPYLLVQVGTVLLGMILMVLVLRTPGRNWLWWLLTVPVAVILWDFGFFLAFIVACQVKWGGCP